MVTDVDDDVVQAAIRNVRRNVPTHMEVIGLVGDVCHPLATLPFGIDIIYANLPNIPSSDGELDDPGTFFRPDGSDAEPETDGYLLGLQRRFLRSAPHVLSPSGIAVLMIGGRFPMRLFDRLGQVTGFAVGELLADFKLQTEADNVTGGYAGFETSGITFEFYRYDEGRRIARDCRGGSGADLKRRLDGCRLTAAEAAREVARGGSVGHTVHMVTATPRTGVVPQDHG